MQKPIELKELVNVSEELVLLENNLKNRMDIELVYADINHPDNHFTYFENNILTTIYPKNMPFFLHKSLWKIVLKALDYIPFEYNIRLYDGLRTTDAQAKMQMPKQIHQWQDYMISTPGRGGHPRGMAVDIMLTLPTDSYTECSVDQATPFDCFDMLDKKTGESVPPQIATRDVAYSKADRNSPFITQYQRDNQLILERAMLLASFDYNTPITPLPFEHWDFRFPKDETDLKAILESIGRILYTKPYFIEDNINNYNDFLNYWQIHFTSLQDLQIKKFGRILTIPSLNSFIFYFDYAPLSDNDIRL